MIVELEFQLAEETSHLYVQVGTTSSTAVDPLLALGNIAKVVLFLIELGNYKNALHVPM